MSSTDTFWAEVLSQLEDLKSATNATDVLRILAPTRNPYGPDHASHAFFAGSGGDDQVRDSLCEAGWCVIWEEASYFYVAQAPDGTMITYIEGDVFEGCSQASDALVS